MAGENVVSIIVRAVDDTKAGFAEADATAAESGSKFEGFGNKAKAAFLGVAVGAGFAIDAAMKYQEESTTLVTGAGESASALGKVKQGMLDISTATATSLPQVVSGMYMIESAGYHGAAGLTILKAAAEGAKVGNADLGTVANALTTVLTDYKMPADQAAAATSGLVAIVASGKTHMEDLASSLSKVLPTASALHVPFAQVGGAMATMTAEGNTARLSAMALNSTMISIAAPTKAAATAMAGVGLNSEHVANTLTHQGLIAALTEVTDAVGKKFPPGSAQYVAALNAMLGGHRGLQVALALTGSHLKDLKDNTDSVSESMRKGATDVQGWDKVQEDSAFQMEKLKQAALNTAVSFGSMLLPAFTKVLTPLADFAAWLSKSSAASTAFAAIVGGVLSVYLGSKLVGAFSDVAAAGSKIIGVIGSIAGKLGIMTAATEAQTVATEEGTAAQEAADVAMDANPIGLIILAITALIAIIVLMVTHWKDVESVAKTVWNAVKTAVETAFNWIRSNWPLILAIITGPIGVATLFVVDHWKQILNGAKSMLDDVVSFFRGLPGRIISALASLGSMMFNAGKNAIQRLIDGIGSMIGAVGNAVSSIASKVAGFFGLSPAVEGPLSAGGAPEIRGQHFAADIARGMMSGRGAIASAAASLAGSAGISGSAAAGGAGAGGGGTLTLQIAPGASSGLEAQFWTWLKNGIRAQGGDPRVITRKVQFA